MNIKVSAIIEKLVSEKDAPRAPKKVSQSFYISQDLLSRFRTSVPDSISLSAVVESLIEGFVKSREDEVASTPPPDPPTEQ